MILQLRAILFDMDGVLVSSTVADERSWLRWARLREMEETFSIHETHGRRTVDTIRALRPDLDPMEEELLLEGYDAEDRDGLRVFPGVVSLLSSLPPDKWAIVTSASGRLMRSRLTHAGVPISAVVVTSEMVQHGKPNPEPYVLGARLLGFPPGECLVIEDAPSGIAAGKAAGCKVLAVTSSHDAAELSEADWIIPELSGITVHAEAAGLLRVSFEPAT